jgi:hypothetical protein
MARRVQAHHNWLVEKTPSQSHSASAIFELFPDARFVHVVRDPRDVIVSRLTRRRHNPDDRGTDVQPRPTVTKWAKTWVETMRIMDTLARRAPVHEIRYEDLASDPLTICRDLFAFCGIPCEQKEIEDIVADNRLSAHAIRGPGYFRGTGRVGGWRSELPRSHDILIRSVAGREMEARGYLTKAGLSYSARRVTVSLTHGAKRMARKPAEAYWLRTRSST